MNQSSIIQCGSRRLDVSAPVIMGVLNVTPDSFSDGGLHAAPTQALVHAAEMVSAGAEVIDIGGESTRPGATPVSTQAELDRVIPALERIVSELDVTISVDTSNPEVMAAAIAAGAHMINDVRALTRPGAVEIVASSDVAVCLMHMQGSPATMQAQPEYHDVVNAVKAFLQERALLCQHAGIGAERIVLDPGFGFGKTLEHNYLLLNQLAAIHCLGYPLLLGVSRKSMIGLVTQRSAPERAVGSAVALTLGLLSGPAIVRVHDIAATRDALAVLAAFQQSGQ